MTTYITIGAGIIKRDAHTFQNYWNPNDPYVEGEVTVISEEEEDNDFELKIELLKNEKTFSPLEIPAYEKTSNKEIPTYNKIPENGIIKFEIEVFKNNIDSFDIEILQDDIIIYAIK